MNGAELKTIRESLGLSLQWLADKASVSHRSAAYWEAGAKIPNDVIKLILSLEKSVNNAVANALISIIDATENQQGLPDRIVLVRYKTDQDLWRFRKDMAGFPASYHASILYRLRTEITKLGIACHVVWLDPIKYIEWLGNREDSESMRSAWAALA
jgi:transcriptional regulator with XRE-family HTH domain